MKTTKAMSNEDALAKAEKQIEQFKESRDKTDDYNKSIPQKIEEFHATFDFLKVRTPLRTPRYEGA